MTDRIKECPLCDGEAVVVETGRPYTLIRYFVSCNSCGLETARIYRTRKEAIDKWNTRKPMDRIVEELETWAKSSERLYFEYYEEECYGAWRSYNNAIKIVKREV